MTRKCSSLQKNEIVVFKAYNPIYEEKKPIDGNVISVDLERKTVDVVFLWGYRSENETIPFSDMLAVYNPKGEYMKFDNICGNSDLLIPE